MKVNSSVFWGSSVIVAFFLTLGMLIPLRLETFFKAFQESIVGVFGWFYIFAMTGFVIFAVFLAGSRFGEIKLGTSDSEPEFNTATWFAMLFSAGMGIGLLFYSVAEPILHYISPPQGRGGSLDAARTAMGLTFFHWGLHPWAVYAIVGLSLAYFGYRKGLPFSIRSAFYPLIGERVYGPLGDAIDVLAVVSTLFGVATSLGLGAMQVNAGLNYLFAVPEILEVRLALIAIITAAATVSVVTGLHSGIRRLSEINLSLALILLIFVAVFGPFGFICNAFVENLGTYFQLLPENSFWTAAYEEPSGEPGLATGQCFIGPGGFLGLPL